MAEVVGVCHSEKATWVQVVPLKFRRPALAHDPDVGGRDRVDGPRGVTAGMYASALHVVPLNCRTSIRLSPALPTAKMSVLETAEMPVNAALAVDAGAWTMLQLVPLKFSIRSPDRCRRCPRPRRRWARWRSPH